jgi:hypothetical protein
VGIAENRRDEAVFASELGAEGIAFDRVGATISIWLAKRYPRRAIVSIKRGVSDESPSA